MRKAHSIQNGSAVLEVVALLVMFVATSTPAFAVPSYARQTGYPCSQCHTTPPELTQEGRDFKLNGYTLRPESTHSITRPATDKSAGLNLLESLPLSAWFQTSYTATHVAQPAAQNGTIEFPQTLSLFLSGAWATDVGSFLQVTYSAADNHFRIDNTDIRYARQAMLFNKDLHYGVTLNNNPTVEDLWNSTPAWGFPFFSTDVAPTPIAAPVVAGPLAQDVVGIGVYGLWMNRWYGAVTLYRTDHIGSATPVTGTGANFNILGAAPYWRVAWQHPSKNNYLAVGAYGMHVASSPGGVNEPTDAYTDVAADVQYDRTVPGVASDFFCEKPPCTDVFSLRGTYIHETSTLDATFGAGGASQLGHHLHTFQANGEYHWGDRLSAAAGWFSVSGTADQLLYAQAPVTGSLNGSPNSHGYILNATWWPSMNINVMAQYTGYLKFNGAGSNYDGAGRNASGNNSIYLSASFVF